MGSSTDFRNYDDKLARKQIEQMWAWAVHQSQAEDGHSYSGTIGMLGSHIAAWHDLKLDQHAASEWIVAHHQKWEPAIAVSYLKRENASAADILAAQILLKEAGDLRLLARGVKQAAIVDLKDGVEFITCKNGCKSRIAVKFITDITCPLCQAKLIGVRFDNKITAALDEAKVKNDKALVLQQGKLGKEKAWVIGGWCSC